MENIEDPLDRHACLIKMTKESREAENYERLIEAIIKCDLRQYHALLSKVYLRLKTKDY